MGTKLLVREGQQGLERWVDVTADDVWIGRAPECSVRSDDALVSRKHAVLKRRDGKFVIEDLRSANGVFVNDKRVTEPQAVTPDDVIRCGGVVLRIVVEAAPAFVPPTFVPPPSPVISAPPAAPPIAAPAAPSPRMSELEKERDELAREVARLRSANAETAGLRAENESLKRRVQDLTAQVADRDDALENEKRAVEDMKTEMATAVSDAQAAAAELVASRLAAERGQRKASLAEVEVARLKEELEKLRKEVSEMARIKDEGWRQVNNHVSDLEQLREVVRQQNAVLEERRVRLLVLESANRPRST